MASVRVKGRYSMSCTLPHGNRGKHLLYLYGLEDRSNMSSMIWHNAYERTLHVATHCANELAILLLNIIYLNTEILLLKLSWPSLCAPTCFQMKGKGTWKHQAGCLWVPAGRPIIWLWDHHYLHKKSLKVEKGQSRGFPLTKSTKTKLFSHPQVLTCLFSLFTRTQATGILIEVPCLRKVLESVQSWVGCWGLGRMKGRQEHVWCFRETENE